MSKQAENIDEVVGIKEYKLLSSNKSYLDYCNWERRKCTIEIRVGAL